VYAHCIYCTGHLGRNERLERFAVGRRLAFDAGRGRLWVVCPRCSRWNLSPVEERWEVIEECERLFAGVRRQVSTEHIALGVVPPGLELVRIGGPRRPEMAAWRYGRTLLRRRRRSHVTGVIETGAIFGTSFALPALLAWRVWQDSRVVARLPRPDGRTVDVTRRHAAGIRLHGGDQAWRLQVPGRNSQLVTLSGTEAIRAAGQLLPSLNRKGGNEEQVAHAVAELERAGNTEAYFAAAAQRLRTRHTLLRGPDPHLHRAPTELRLALEMAAHEEAEQRALEGELRDLQLAWQQAEEIAAIADSLFLPRSVTDALERLRRGGRGG
jgi:hypothetical protein